MKRWYLVLTKPACEALAQENLLRQGYEVYLPRLLQAVRGRGGWRDRIVTLFPRYLFLGLMEGLQPLAPARSSLGVSNVVRFGSAYANVPESVIQNLRARADPVSGLHRLASPAPIAAGTPVRVLEGPFRGLEGIFERAAGSERVLVLLRFLSRNASVRVPLDAVAPLHAV